MHPMFAKASDGATIPILFVNAATFEGVVQKVDDREQVYVRATRFEPRPGRHLFVPKADGPLAGVLFGIEAPDAPTKDLFRPGQLVTLLPPGTYRFANAPHDARLARFPSRSAPISSRATARRRRATGGWCCPTASTARTSPAS